MLQVLTPRGAHRGEGVVGALPPVDVVVRVHQALVAQRASKQLNRAVRNHLRAQGAASHHVIRQTRLPAECCSEQLLSAVLKLLLLQRAAWYQGISSGFRAVGFILNCQP